MPPSAPPAITPLTALALEIHDALMVTAPRGWQRVEIDLERRGGALRVREMRSALDPAAAGADKPDLGIDAHEFAGILAAAASDLLGVARAAGTPWTGAAMAMHREGRARAVLELREPGGAVARRIELGPDALDALVFTEALFDALVEVEPIAARNEAALEADIAGHDEWNYEQQSCELLLSKGVLPWRTLPAQIIGTYAPESATFLWGWANEHVDPRCTRAVVALREWARTVPGMRVLLRPSLPCEEGFSVKLARLAAVRMGARGVYRASFGPGVLAFAVFPPAPPAS